MRSILIAILFVAIFCAAYVQITEQARKERNRIYGRWQVYSLAGHPLMQPSGEPVVIEFEYNSFNVYPNHDPPWLDLYTNNGTSHAIYRWDGDDLRVTEASSGLERPTLFDPRNENVRPKRGTKAGAASVTPYVLRRFEN